MADTELNILRESLDLLVLKALTWGPKHGYAVAEWIEEQGIGIARFDVHNAGSFTAAALTMLILTAWSDLPPVLTIGLFAVFAIELPQTGIAS